MTSKEDFNKLRELFYVEWLEEGFDDVGVWNNLEKDLEELEKYKKAMCTPIKDLINLEILEMLKSSIMLIENKQITLGYGKYKLAIRPDVILSDDTIKVIKEWIDNGN